MYMIFRQISILCFLSTSYGFKSKNNAAIKLLFSAIQKSFINLDSNTNTQPVTLETDNIDLVDILNNPSTQENALNQRASKDSSNIHIPSKEDLNYIKIPNKLAETFDDSYDIMSPISFSDLRNSQINNKKLFDTLPGSNIPVHEDQEYKIKNDLFLTIKDDSLLKYADGDYSMHLMLPLAKMAPTNSLFRTLAVAIVGPSHIPYLKYVNLSKELCLKYKIPLMNEKSYVSQKAIGYLKLTKLPDIPILVDYNTPGFIALVKLPNQSTQIDDLLTKTFIGLNIPTLTNTELDILDKMCKFKTFKVLLIEKDKKLKLPCYSKLENVIWCENCKIPDIRVYENKQNVSIKPHFEYRWMQNITEKLNEINGLVDETIEAFEEDQEKTESDKTHLDDNLKSLMNQAIDKGAKIIIREEEKKNQINHKEAQNQLNNDKEKYTGGCKRDYSHKCPIKWDFNKESNVCIPPAEYQGSCAPANLKGASTDQKVEFAWKCLAEWPCIKPPKIDFTKIKCPLQWTNERDYICIAPNTYEGHCSHVTDFAKFSNNDRIKWALNCNATWAATEEGLKKTKYADYEKIQPKIIEMNGPIDLHTGDIRHMLQDK